LTQAPEEPRVNLVKPCVYAYPGRILKSDESVFAGGTFSPRLSALPADAGSIDRCCGSRFIILPVVRENGARAGPDGYKRWGNHVDADDII
jgi:hypothetical protein